MFLKPGWGWTLSPRWHKGWVMGEQHEPGQRWVSTSEPELGLGVLLEQDGGRVSILFAVAGEKRLYSLATAPLVRVRFKVGDSILLHDEKTLEVKELREEQGLLYYSDGVQEVCETELSDTISFSKAEDRLLGCQVDDLKTFHLRVESLFRMSQWKKSSVRGLLGGRVDLIPHQIAIAKEVSDRVAPRVLLADEVGLGKTIEACLIMHRLHLTGRADRVLVLLPEPLVHQWFVELLRRFNMMFTIMDEERCASLSGGNPFLESQLCLCSQEMFAAHPERVPQVLEAGWDCLIVDEAHHLEWSPEEVSEGYELVQALAGETASVLLLTATPQQLGAEGHFARLQLLDPDRYADLGEFLVESERYERVADAVDAVQRGEKPDLSGLDRLPSRIAEGLKNLDQEEVREKVVRDLLDSFGTGRVMFRNTRKQLRGFPERKAHLVKLEGDEEEEIPVKVKWLLSLLDQHPGEKMLLICKELETVEDLAGAILDQRDLKLAQFHEELTLLQRDRNAAYFSEENGARLLLCSEIGSEGRNFQFAHHLVLFDLPENPELLEQRIGRLDRIGQTETINLHVPYLAGSRGERYARWYSEGLNAFEKNLQGAAILVKKLQGIKADRLDDFIARSKELRDETEALMERGQDRLLALTSQGRGEVEKTLEQIDGLDRDRAFEAWVLRLFDHFGVVVEEMADRSWILKSGQLTTDVFPGLTEEGMSITFDRGKALAREDMELVTADHPMVRSGVEELLASEAGNSAFGIWEEVGGQAAKSIYLEAYYVIECVAPADLQADHYLPPVPVRVVVDHAGKDCSGNRKLLQAALKKGNHRKLLEQEKLRGEMVPMMLGKLEELAERRREAQVQKALAEMAEGLKSEKERLEDLAEVNPMIGEEEIQDVENRKKALSKAIGGARLRLDGLRMAYRVS